MIDHQENKFQLGIELELMKHLHNYALLDIQRNMPNLKGSMNHLGKFQENLLLKSKNDQPHILYILSSQQKHNFQQDKQWGL